MNPFSLSSFGTILAIVTAVVAQAAPEYPSSNLSYTSLNPNDPIQFFGDAIEYAGERIELGPKALFIDAQLQESLAAQFPYVFCSVNDAVKQLQNGTEAEPMVLYIAPNVYWIDDPDDPELRLPKEVKGAPFGLEIDCEWLRFQGLTKDPQHVVLACNRGQTMGAKGNFTMFKIVGNGTAVENVTFGNYCNVDLKYPLKPELNREKRGSAIVQAQLAICRGDKIFARNAHFISRLNLVPIAGGKRTFFDHCHFECTDDSLASTGVYLDCTFEFYSSKPFGHTEGTGAVFLNCDILSLSRGDQYFIKGGGPMAAIDCRMQSDLATYWGWKDQPEQEQRYYGFHNEFNATSVSIGSRHPYALVDMTDLEVLDAYRFEYAGQVIYNTYNLLRGKDNWDPMGIKPLVLEAERQLGRNLSKVPTLLQVTPTRQLLETGKNTLKLTPIVRRFGEFEHVGETIHWSLPEQYRSLARIEPSLDGTCTVIPNNQQNETMDIVVQASTNSGLQAASVLTISPKFLEAPEFTQSPSIQRNENGTLVMNYQLDVPYEDQSLISWYRCDTPDGDGARLVAVSRSNEPHRVYKLSNADVGYYLMATIQPKHLRCEPGAPVRAFTDGPIEKKEVSAFSGVWQVDLQTLPTQMQPEVKPGFWTLDCFKPEDTNEFMEWRADPVSDPWYFGSGVNGAEHEIGLVQATKGARIRYTPVSGVYGDMKVRFVACPAKTAGQGFSSAKAQYLDICLKYDAQTLTGYALRLFRTTKYHDAIDCQLMRYDNGKAIPLSKAVSTDCYRTPCQIEVAIEGNQLTAHLETKAVFYREPERPAVKSEVNLSAIIEPNAFGGFGLQHTGSVRSGATLIRDLVIEWN